MLTFHTTMFATIHYAKHTSTPLSGPHPRIIYDAYGQRAYAHAAMISTADPNTRSFNPPPSRHNINHWIRFCFIRNILAATLKRVRGIMYRFHAYAMQSVSLAPLCNFHLAKLQSSHPSKLCNRGISWLHLQIFGGVLQTRPQPRNFLILKNEE